MFESKIIHRKWFLRAWPMVPCIHGVFHGLASSKGGSLSFGESIALPMRIPIWGIWLLLPLTTTFFWFFYKNLAQQAVQERLKRVDHLDSSLIGMARQQKWTMVEARIHLISKELKPYDVKLLKHWLTYQKSYFKSDTHQRT